MKTNTTPIIEFEPDPESPGRWRRRYHDLTVFDENPLMAKCSCGNWEYSMTRDDHTPRGLQIDALLGLHKDHVSSIWEDIMKNKHTAPRLRLNVIEEGRMSGASGDTK